MAGSDYLLNFRSNVSPVLSDLRKVEVAALKAQNVARGATKSTPLTPAQQAGGVLGVGVNPQDTKKSLAATKRAISEQVAAARALQVAQGETLGKLSKGKPVFAGSKKTLGQEFDLKAVAARFGVDAAQLEASIRSSAARISAEYNKMLSGLKPGLDKEAAVSEQYRKRLSAAKPVQALVPKGTRTSTAPEPVTSRSTFTSTGRALENLNKFSGQPLGLGGPGAKATAAKQKELAAAIARTTRATEAASVRIAGLLSKGEAAALSAKLRKVGDGALAGNIPGQLTGVSPQDRVNAKVDRDFGSQLRSINKNATAKFGPKVAPQKIADELRRVVSQPGLDVSEEIARIDSALKGGKSRVVDAGTAYGSPLLADASAVDHKRVYQEHKEAYGAVNKRLKETTKPMEGFRREASQLNGVFAQSRSRIRNGFAGFVDTLAGQTKVIGSSIGLGEGAQEKKALNRQGAGGLKGMMGAGIQSALQYTLPSLALFGAGRFLSNSFKEAEEYMKAMKLVEGQIESLMAAQYSGAEATQKAREGTEKMSKSIRETAAAYGIEADIQAKVESRYIGAFQDKSIGGLSGLSLASEQGKGSAKMAAVLGISPDELTDGVVAISRAYGILSEDIGDTALEMQESLGIDAGDTVAVLGDVSAVAKEAGIGFEELSGIIGVTLKNSGRPAAEIAEAYTRVLPFISQQKTELLEMSSTVKGLNTDTFKMAVANGDNLTVLQQLGKAYQLANKEGRKQDALSIGSIVGDERQAKAVFPYLADVKGADTLTERLKSGSQDGALEARYQEISKLITQSMKETSESFKQLSKVFLESGISDALVAIIRGFGTLAEMLTTVAQKFSGVFSIMVKAGIAATALAAATSVLAQAQLWATKSTAVQAGASALSNSGSSMLTGFGAALKKGGPAGARVAAQLEREMVTGAVARSRVPGIAAKRSAELAGVRAAAGLSERAASQAAVTAGASAAAAPATSALAAARAARLDGAGLLGASRAAASKGSVNLARSFTAPFTAGISGGREAAARAAASKGSVNLAQSFITPFTVGMAGGFKAGLSALVASPAAPVAIAALGIGYAANKKAKSLAEESIKRQNKTSNKVNDAKTYAEAREATAADRARLEKSFENDILDRNGLNDTGWMGEVNRMNPLVFAKAGIEAGWDYATGKKGNKDRERDQYFSDLENKAAEENETFEQIDALFNSDKTEDFAKEINEVFNRYDGRVKDKKVNMDVPKKFAVEQALFAQLYGNQAAIQAGIIGEVTGKVTLTQENLEGLAEATQSDDQKEATAALEVLNLLLGSTGKTAFKNAGDVASGVDKDLVEALNVATGRADEQNKEVEKIAYSIEETKALLDQGKISTVTYLNKLAEAREGLELLVKEDPNNKELQTDLNKAASSENEAKLKRATDLLDSRIANLDTVFGTEDSVEKDFAGISTVRRTLKDNPEIEKNPEKFTELAKQLNDYQRSIAQRMVDAAVDDGDLKKAQEIAEKGYEVPKEYQEAALGVEIQNSENSKLVSLVDSISSQTEKNGAMFLAGLTLMSNARAIEAAKAMKNLLEAQFITRNSDVLLEDMNKAMSGEEPFFAEPDKKKPAYQVEYEKAQKGLDEFIKSKREGSLEKDYGVTTPKKGAKGKVKGPTDKEIAEDEKKKAEEAEKRAEEAKQKAEEARQKAKEDAQSRVQNAIDRAKSVSRKNPLALAQLDVQQATQLLAIAKSYGDASEIEAAITASLQAQHALEDALTAIAESQRDMSFELQKLQFRKDVVKTAQIDSQSALARAEAAAKTGNVIEYNTAIVALRQAEAVLNDAMSERALAVYNSTVDFWMLDRRGDTVAQASGNAAKALAAVNAANAAGDVDGARDALLALRQAEAEVNDAIQARALAVYNTTVDLWKLARREDPVAQASGEVSKALAALNFAQAAGNPDEVRDAGLAVHQAKAEMADAVRDAGRQRIEDYYSLLELQAQGDPVAVANIQIHKAFQQLAMSSQATMAADQQAMISAQQAMKDANVDIMRSTIEFQKAAADPENAVAQAELDVKMAELEVAVASGQAAKTRAKARLIEAQRSLQEASKSLNEGEFEAYINLFKAFYDMNDIAIAQMDVALADNKMKEAKTKAERINAQADKIRAQQGQANALREIQEANDNLAQAMLEFVGDSVAASDYAVVAARRNLDDILAKYRSGKADGGDVAGARAELTNALGRQRDSILNDKKDQYSFLYDMEKISKSQYVAYLEQLRQMPDLTQDQLRDIERQIKGLKDDLGADLQFNLPSILSMPGFYEPRRLDQTAQTPGYSIGYQDNRDVQITLNIANGMTQQEATDMLGAALNDNRTGNRIGRY